ncbi:MAG TPA: DNA gyrase inhibitor YacG [Candidatus Binatia bacterium]|nr:DNA gyrase inhibitor YacG [Candidatus Binatia bacterium]
MRCPTCKQLFEPSSSPCPPFCSKRCKLLDLGRWLDGSYAVPGEPASEEELAAEMQRILAEKGGREN